MHEFVYVERIRHVDMRLLWLKYASAIDRHLAGTDHAVSGDLDVSEYTLGNLHIRLIKTKHVLKQAR